MGKGSAADQKLLLAILATHDIKLNYDAVAAIFGPHCTARAVHERIKKLKIMAKEDDDSSPDSTPTKSTAAAKKAVVPKSKANAKSKGPDGNVQTPKKRKTNNAGIAATKTDSGEGVKKGEPVLGDKRKIDEILVSDDGNDGHTPVKEEPPNFDGDLSDISIFDPAEDQLLAEQEASLNAI
ncbi:MAG: hypothetical protein Q9195_008931 [Heterodermia aff. obscurata]